MKNINDLLKIAALCFTLLGTLCIFMPNLINAFLNDAQAMPKLLFLSLGVVLNIYGLLLMWLAKRTPVPLAALLAVIVGDFTWAIGALGLIAFTPWITSINGTTVLGLVTISLTWFGWLKLKHYLAHKN